MIATATVSAQTYYRDRLANVIARERNERGLIGVRIFARESDDMTNETIARDVLALHDEVLAGNADDITGKEI
jgi:hypothetical protein